MASTQAVAMRESQGSLEIGGGSNVLRGSEKVTPAAEAEGVVHTVCPKR